jgi:hypothetical protein
MRQEFCPPTFSQATTEGMPMRKPSPAMIVALLGVFLGLGGVGLAANGQSLILGSANNAATAQTALTGTTSSAALAVTNNGGGVPLKLTAPSGKPPLVLNSPTKVASLNADLLDNLDSGYFLPKTGTAANSSKLGGQLPSYFLPKTGKAADSDKLDGLDSLAFVSASAVRRVGPLTFAASSGNGDYHPIADIGQLSFSGECLDTGMDQGVRLFMTSSVAHASYADYASGLPAGVTSSADVAANALNWLASVGSPDVTHGAHVFAFARGEALSADGHHVSYNLYMGQNAQGTGGGQCVFGGAFVVN